MFTFNALLHRVFTTVYSPNTGVILTKELRVVTLFALEALAILLKHGPHALMRMLSRTMGPRVERVNS